MCLTSHTLIFLVFYGLNIWKGSLIQQYLSGSIVKVDEGETNELCYCGVDELIISKEVYL